MGRGPAPRPARGGLIQLFDPPFDQSHLNPGYIKGYIPGVRENGGQYTHAAIWTVMAFARLGEHERAWELFDLLNPVHHGDTPERKSPPTKVEPYVVAADVYAVAPHTGRGGWTWYTGSAGWMYRLLVETLLGSEPSYKTASGTDHITVRGRGRAVCSPARRPAPGWRCDPAGRRPAGTCGGVAGVIGGGGRGFVQVRTSLEGQAPPARGQHTVCRPHISQRRRSNWCATRPASAPTRA
jgi:hypothetical protein